MTEILGPLVTFAVATSVTPGPNNVMITASGANFGFERSVPHMLGIGLGFMAMIVGIGLGLGQVFESLPALHQILRYGGAAYLLYLACRIAMAAPTTTGATPSTARPLTFREAALFQWVNPKGWMMAVGALGTYTTVGGNFVAETIVVALVFGAVGLPSVALWALLGVGIGRLLQARWAMRTFNIAMALLLVASLVIMFV